MKKSLLLITALLTLSSCSNIYQPVDVPAVTSATVSVSVSESRLETSSKSEPKSETSVSIKNTNNTILNSSFGDKNGASAYCEVNGNVPFFTDEEKICADPFEIYSELDDLGRCGPAFANVCKEIMPTEERGKIGMIKPSGWHTSKYDKTVISDMYLYNRCHLIAYMLGAENANEKNLITGTRYLNVEGMLPFEIKVGDYIEQNPENHVLYRVTPVFEGEDLVAQGVLMEAWSVEDDGQGICFCVFCYNIQPNIYIDYSTGDNHLNENYVSITEATTSKPIASPETVIIEDKTSGYILNTNTKKIHRPDCSSVKDMKEKNKKQTDKTIEELISEGYSPCKVCNP